VQLVSLSFLPRRQDTELHLRWMFATVTPLFTLLILRLNHILLVKMATVEPPSF